MAPLDENGALWEYDPGTRKWTSIEPADPNTPRPQNRSYHAMTSDGLRTIFLHAGCPEKGRLGDLWSFDLSKRVWTELQSAPDPPRGGTSIALLRNKLYRMNGFDGKTEQGGTIDVFDTGNKDWMTRTFEPDGGSGPSPRSVGSLLPLTINGCDSLVTMFGEADPSNLGHQGASKMLSDVWIYEVVSGKWNKLEASGDDLPQPRGWFAAGVAKLDGKEVVAVHGGMSEQNERLDDLWLLHLD